MRASRNSLANCALFSGALFSIVNGRCDPSSNPSGDIVEDSTTYYEDVAPLMAQNRVSCHQAGAIAPFELTS